MLSFSPHFVNSRSTRFSSIRSGANMASAMPCGGILIEVEPRCTETQIHIDDDGLGIEVPCDREADVVRDRGCADPTLGTGYGDDLADGLCSRTSVKMRDGADEFEDIERRDEIFADAARDKLAVKKDVVGAPGDDHLGAGIAEFGKGIDVRDEFAAAGGKIEDNDIWRGSVAVGLDRSESASQVHAHMRPLDPAIGCGRLDDPRGFRQFAESLQGDARHRGNLREFEVGWPFISSPPPPPPLPPTLLMSELTNFQVPGSWPLRRLSMARVRIAVSIGASLEARRDRADRRPARRTRIDRRNRNSSRACCSSPRGRRYQLQGPLATVRTGPRRLP